MSVKVSKCQTHFDSTRCSVSNNPNMTLYDSCWEQQTHRQSAILLKIRGYVYSVVNLVRMNR